MNDRERKEMETIARLVAAHVARCPQIFGQLSGAQRCTKPRGHDGPCDDSATRTMPWDALEPGWKPPR